MRCHLVSGPTTRKYAPTAALARAVREEIMVVDDCKKKDVVIEEAEIPTAKPELIEFVNALIGELTATEEE